MTLTAKTGYSDKTLAQKLGLKPGMRALSISAPAAYKTWLGPSSGLIKPKLNPPYDFVHLFSNQLADLEEQLARLRNEINPDGMIWISWYKKSAKKPTEITENLIRDTCIPLGLVDIKVCSVSEDWSGLKLVIPLALR
jgi:hypothetical protein